MRLVTFKVKLWESDQYDFGQKNCRGYGKFLKLDFRFLDHMRGRLSNANFRLIMLLLEHCAKQQSSIITLNEITVREAVGRTRRHLEWHYSTPSMAQLIEIIQIEPPIRREEKRKEEVLVKKELSSKNVHYASKVAHENLADDALIDNHSQKETGLKQNNLSPAKRQSLRFEAAEHLNLLRQIWPKRIPLALESQLDKILEMFHTGQEFADFLNELAVRPALKGALPEKTAAYYFQAIKNEILAFQEAKTKGIIADGGDVVNG